MTYEDCEGGVANGFTFYRSYYEAARSLGEKQRLALYEAIIEYAIDGVQVELSGVVRSMFVLIKPTLDKSKSRSAAGFNGGKAKRKQTEGKTEAEGKQGGSDTDIDKDADKDADFKTQQSSFYGTRPAKPVRPDPFMESALRAVEHAKRFNK
jgi:hypothetical protein